MKASKQTFNVRALSAIGVTSVMCWIFAYTAINVFEDYAFGLFIWLPIVLGATSTLIYGYDQIVPKRKLFGISMWTLFVFCLGLLAFAWEGVICMIMAYPLGLLFTWAGHLIGHKLLQIKFGNTSAPIILLFLSVPAFMAFESTNQGEDELRSVITSVEINAPEEEVWKLVVAFPELKKPTELIFKTGIAYPTDATITGTGVGAVRHCNFSTGAFIEPITVWDPSRLLKFSVVEQPPTMKELSIYNIEPNHLHGYWVSKEGQFKIKKLPNGKTLLEGTTWYINKIKPGFYWTLWSDHIVHKIHNRVLNHIKELAEAKVISSNTE